MFAGTINVRNALLRIALSNPLRYQCKHPSSGTECSLWLQATGNSVQFGSLALHLADALAHAREVAITRHAVH